MYLYDILLFLSMYLYAVVVIIYKIQSTIKRSITWQLILRIFHKNQNSRFLNYFWRNRKLVFLIFSGNGQYYYDRNQNSKSQNT